MSALFEIKATDWNGKTMDGCPFELVGYFPDGDLRKTAVISAEQRADFHEQLAKALEAAQTKQRLNISPGFSSDYVHFEIIDPEFNVGKPVVYGPGDFVLMISESLALWLPRAAIRALQPGVWA